MIYSHSRINTFEQCPLKFKFRYIDNLIPDTKQFIEGFLGNKIHETLEWLYNLENKKISLDDLIHYFIRIWKKSFSPEIKIIKNENEDFYLNQGIKFLINYFDSNYPFEDNTIATEKKVLINLDDKGEYKLQGYIDRLVYHPDLKKIEIHDYKTGSIKTQEELDKDKQLSIYSLGVKNLFDELREINLVWHFLAFNKKMISKRNDKQLEDIKKEILTIIKKIESTKEFNANPGILCSWCEFKSYCPLFSDLS